MAEKPTPTALERIADLRRTAAITPTTEQEMTARASAVRTLRQLERRGVQPPAPPRWHPNPGSPWEELDSADTPEVRERWFRYLYRDG